MTDDAAIRIAHLEAHLKDCVMAIARGQASKLTAIRAYRALTGATLKDSKDYVERFEAAREPGSDDARIQRLEDRLHYLERRVSSIFVSSDNANSEA